MAPVSVALNTSNAHPTTPARILKAPTEEICQTWIRGSRKWAASGEGFMTEDPVNEELVEMDRKLRHLMADAEADARATEKEATSIRSHSHAIVSEQWSAILAEAASAQAEMRRLQLALVHEKIEFSRAIHCSQSQTFATAGRKAADLIEAAERARDDALEKATTYAAGISDGTEEEARRRYQSALFYTTIFFDEVVRQATELLDAAEADTSGSWKESVQRP